MKGSSGYFDLNGSGGYLGGSAGGRLKGLLGQGDLFSTPPSQVQQNFQAFQSYQSTVPTPRTTQPVAIGATNTGFVPVKTGAYDSSGVERPQSGSVVLPAEAEADTEGGGLKKLVLVGLAIAGVVYLLSKRNSPPSVANPKHRCRHAHGRHAHGKKRG